MKITVWHTSEPCTIQIRNRNVMQGEAGWVCNLLIYYLFVLQSLSHIFISLIHSTLPYRFLLSLDVSRLNLILPLSPSHFKRLAFNPKISLNLLSSSKTVLDISLTNVDFGISVHTDNTMKPCVC